LNKASSKGKKKEGTKDQSYSHQSTKQRRNKGRRIFSILWLSISIKKRRLLVSNLKAQPKEGTRRKTKKNPENKIKASSSTVFVFSSGFWRVEQKKKRRRRTNVYQAFFCKSNQIRFVLQETPSFAMQASDKGTRSKLYCSTSQATSSPHESMKKLRAKNSHAQ